MFVPEIEPRSIRSPALWQMAWGASGGVLMAFVLQPSPLGFAAGGLIGVVLGFLAPYWLKYANF
jgi:hypothetical protein